MDTRIPCHYIQVTASDPGPALKHPTQRPKASPGRETRLSQLDRIQPVLNANGMDCIKG